MRAATDQPTVPKVKSARVCSGINNLMVCRAVGSGGGSRDAAHLIWRADLDPFFFLFASSLEAGFFFLSRGVGRLGG